MIDRCPNDCLTFDEEVFFVMEDFFLVIVGVFVILKIADAFMSCNHCSGSGRDRIIIKDSGGNKTEIDTGRVCRFCRGSGRK